MKEFVKKIWINKKARWTVVLAILAVFALILVCFLRHKALKVALGVEHAVTIAYSGPELAIVPYKIGVAVNLRIAQVIEQKKARIYDVRYILNSTGTFNITEYLTSKDGSPITDLPACNVQGVQQLSKKMERRLKDTESIVIEIPHMYYESLTLISILMVIWLFLLIFAGRVRKKHVQQVVHVSSLEEILRAILERMRQGNLSIEEKTELENLLFKIWRQELDLTGQEMYQAVRQIEDNNKTGEAYNQLEYWLHKPVSSISEADMIQLLTPFSIEKKPLTQEAAK